MVNRFRWTFERTLIACVLLAALPLASCGGGEPAPSASGAVATTSTTATAPPTASSRVRRRALEARSADHSKPSPAHPTGRTHSWARARSYARAHAPASAPAAAHSRKPAPGPGTSPVKAPAAVPASDGTHRPNTLALPSRGYPILYVRHHRRVALRTAPGGGRLVRRLGAHTPYGSPTALSVVRRTRYWAGVATPYLANGQLAWVRLDRRRLATGWTRLAIAVDLSTRRADLLNGHHVVRRFPVTVGAPGSTTPLGRYAITDTFRGGLNPAYGCCALALSARQSNLPSGWLGGNRIAIHGTYGPVGYAESHGCIRASNANASALVSRVYPGTPVLIRG